MPTFGDKWKEAREAAGLSAIRTAELAGLHRNTIYDLENERDGVTLRVMKQIAAIYGVTLGHIFATEPEIEAVPSELRPLAEFIRPLSFEDRVAIVRNITSNLKFAASITMDGIKSSRVSSQPSSQNFDAVSFGGDTRGQASAETTNAPRLRGHNSETEEVITDHAFTEPTASQTGRPVRNVRPTKKLAHKEPATPKRTGTGK